MAESDAREHHRQCTNARRWFSVNARTASAKSDWDDPRTSARSHFADALVVRIGNENITVRIDSQAIRTAEAGVGPRCVGIRAVDAVDPTRKR
jgi:hypothetical protein